jgi:Na+/H+-dicarboxylate symporter
MKFWIKMVAGLFLGIVIGSYIGPASFSYEPLRVIGMFFLKLFNFAVLPLLLFSSVRSLISLRTNKRLFVVLVKSLGYFILLTAVGAAVGLIMGGVLKPGVGVNIQEAASPSSFYYPSTADFILNIVPGSIEEFLKSGYAVLAVLFVSYLAASAIILTKSDADPLHALIVSIEKTLHRINLIVLEFLPVGIFAYVGYTMGSLNAVKVMPFLKLYFVAIAAAFVQVFIVQALFVFFKTKLNPFKFLLTVVPSGIMGYVSGHRYSAYPVLIESMEHNLGADRELVTFVTGIGTAFGLSGTALVTAVTALFVAQAYGLSLSVYLQIIIVLILTFATMKMDGIREGTIVLLTVLLSQIVKLPDEGYALVLGSTMIVDQIAAVVDVTGNAAISYIICHSEEGVKSVSMKDFL